MKPMYLREVENNPNASGPYAEQMRMMRSHGATVPQIMHLFAFKPEVTKGLEEFSEGVMRGPSPLSPGMRELIAAFTSRRNDCEF
jgi:hypothetical protein